MEERARGGRGPENDGWLEVDKRARMVTTRTIKTAGSPITRMFGGKFRSTLCAQQQKDSSIVEGWQLDIHQSRATMHLFAAFVANDLAHTAGHHYYASQQVLIETVPPVLVLHTTRFLYDTKVNGVVKIGKQGTFEPELEISPEIMAGARRGAGAARYELFGGFLPDSFAQFYNHHGLSMLGGHHTLNVLHPNRDPQWQHPHLSVDKTKICRPVVSLCPTEHIFGPHVSRRLVVDPYPPPRGFTLRWI
ncbi:hypothetical protein FIBSPDRAFT_860708 [Athelia psychrophila]|uniref:Peptidase C19 ubiquitin carboxyl-terminal hydrolase domain-containing protein n=1 Tax=Athelia psychrophila TaxID=1759441 RepID=A0A166JVN0_9AGAM|nr:hypothetical protein FIBSPDRAFT_860708 [Fibularhizoctonia sp. CBS 109695]